MLPVFITVGAVIVTPALVAPGMLPAAEIVAELGMLLVALKFTTPPRVEMVPALLIDAALRVRLPALVRVAPDSMLAVVAVLSTGAELVVAKLSVPCTSSGVMPPLLLLVLVITTGLVVLLKPWPMIVTPAGISIAATCRIFCKLAPLPV